MDRTTGSQTGFLYLPQHVMDTQPRHSSVARPGRRFAKLQLLVSANSYRIPYPILKSRSPYIYLLDQLSEGSGAKYREWRHDPERRHTRHLLGLRRCGYTAVIPGTFVSVSTRGRNTGRLTNVHVLPVLDARRPTTMSAPITASGPCCTS